MSKTGTGKTLAYSLLIMHHLLDEDSFFYCLILLPTRELAQQVNAFLRELGQEIGLKMAILIGGEDLLLQGKNLAARPHVVIGTPGLVEYHLRNTKGFDVSTFRYII